MWLLNILVSKKCGTQEKGLHRLRVAASAEQGRPDSTGSRGAAPGPRRVAALGRKALRFASDQAPVSVRLSAQSCDFAKAEPNLFDLYRV